MGNPKKPKTSSPPATQSNSDPALRVAEELGRIVGKFLADEADVSRKSEAKHDGSSNRN